MTESNEPRPFNECRRASDTYVPISLMVSVIAILSGLQIICTPIINNQVEIQSRLTRLEARLEFSCGKK
jgi:hypothetical protein